MIERQSDRIAVKWPIRFERSFTGRWSGTQEALCINVGGNGMLLVLSDPPQKDEILRLHMRDVNTNSPFTLAQVRWSKPDALASNAPSLAGIEYIGTSDGSHGRSLTDRYGVVSDNPIEA